MQVATMSVQFWGLQEGIDTVPFNETITDGWIQSRCDGQLGWCNLIRLRSVFEDGSKSLSLSAVYQYVRWLLLESLCPFRLLKPCQALPC